MQAQALLVRALDQHLLDGCPPAPGFGAGSSSPAGASRIWLRSSLISSGTWPGRAAAGVPRADGILEDVGHVVIHRLEELAGLREILLGFAGKTDDDIGREIHVRADPAQIVDDLLVALAGVGPVHRAQDAVAARLQRQVHVFTQFRQPAVGLDQIPLESQRMRRRETDAGEAVDRVDPFEQLHERRQTAGVDTSRAGRSW